MSIAMTSAEKQSAGSADALDHALGRAREALCAAQHESGYWCFELEADCTIPAEYILMMHFVGEVDHGLQSRLARYLRAHQGGDGGWPLYYQADLELSCSVKAYFALKLAGDDPNAPHMSRAREAILDRGGAARANVFTRIALAQFGQIPWRGVPFMPVEILLLPRWAPFHLSKVSYWSRTVMVPLLVLCSARAQARNPNGIDVAELFTVPPLQERGYFTAHSAMNRLFLTLDRCGRWLEPLMPSRLRRRAVNWAEAWVLERLNGLGGLGAIFPAMVNAYEMLLHLGYLPDHPQVRTARQAIDRLLVDRGESSYCQPCASPVWDTGLSCLALQDTDLAATRPAVRQALDWLRERQLLTAPGDWRDDHPDLPGGGWPFQFDNDYYPDLDDTSVVAWAMDQDGDPRYREAIMRAAHWLVGMQSRTGGFASFDADNEHYYLNEIPFADHGALLDPPTADVTARCVALISRVLSQDAAGKAAVERGLAYLEKEQEAEGAWFGRWGTNYIYGTWSVLAALERVGLPKDHPMIRKAVAWLLDKQRPDGGWGESNDTYHDPGTAGEGPASTGYHTAWAVLGLLAAGAGDCEAVRRGVDFLVRQQREDGFWGDPWFNAPGFPRFFYLKYHGYHRHFPLWALARYRKLVDGAAP